MHVVKTTSLNNTRLLFCAQAADSVRAQTRLAGFEPATNGLEGHCSSAELQAQSDFMKVNDVKEVGARGFEPPTTCTQNRCATRLRHTPMCMTNFMLIIRPKTKSQEIFRSAASKHVGLDPDG